MSNATFPFSPGSYNASIPISNHWATYSMWTTAMAHQPQPCLFLHFPTRSTFSLHFRSTHSHTHLPTQPLSATTFSGGYPNWPRTDAKPRVRHFPGPRKSRKPRDINRPLLAVAAVLDLYVPFSLLPTHVINITHRL